MKKPFIVLSPTYHAQSAGIRVLHTLCEELNKCGREAYLVFYGASPENKRLMMFTVKDHEDFYHPGYSHIRRLPDSANAAEDHRQLIDNAIVIYPESLNGNPLGAKQVARYILSNPKMHIKPPVFSENEFVISFASGFCENPDCLLPMMFEDVLFNDRETLPALQRKMDCSYIGKGAKFGDTFKIPGTVMIHRHWPDDKDGLAAMLRNTRYFYTWDVISQTNIDAVLCGAIPVFMRFPPYKPEVLMIEGVQMPYAEMQVRNGQPIIAYNGAEYETRRQTFLKHYYGLARSCTERVEAIATLMEKHFATRETQLSEESENQLVSGQ